jgi:tetratricopeptide (TPR) repeat protein
MKIFKILVLVLTLGTIVGIGSSGWCQDQEPGWYENKSAEDFVHWGDRLSRFKKDWRKAIYAYEQALVRDPNNAKAHLGLARVYMQRDDYLRAAEEFEKTLSFAQSEDSKLFENKSDAFDFFFTAAEMIIEALKDPDRAQPFLEKAKEIYPSDPRLAKLEEDARRIKEYGPAKAEVGKEYELSRWRRETLVQIEPELLQGYALKLDVPEQKEVVIPIIHVLDDARANLARAFDFTPKGSVPLTIFTRLAFEDQVNLFLSGTYVGSSDQIIIQTRGADTNADIFKEILFHQYGRIWLRAYLDSDSPRWLSEGFAVWSQKLAITSSIHIPRAAMESYRMVDYLIGESPTRFRRFLNDLKTTRDLPLTLQNVYEISMEELQRRGKL